MLRVCWKGANTAARKCLCENIAVHPRQQCRHYTSAGSSGSAGGKIVAASVLTVGGGLGGTILYAKWDPKFRTNVEKSVPYSDKLFELTLGPPPPPLVPFSKKPAKVEPLQISSVSEAAKDSKQPKSKGNAEEKQPKSALETPAQSSQTLEEASAEAAHIISAIGEVQSVPAPATSHDPASVPPAEECHECAHHEPALKERPMEEVAARLAQQDQAEQDTLAALAFGLEEALGTSAKLTLHAIGAQEAALLAINTHTHRLREAMDSEDSPDKKSAQWKDLEDALRHRTHSVDQAGQALLQAKYAQMLEYSDLKGHFI